MKKIARVAEGDINLSPLRTKWQQTHNSEQTRRLLEEDSSYFLHQSLSTPCLDVLQSCHGSSIENLDGKSSLDFHGNSVHQVGFANPRVIKAISDQLATLPFCTRRYTNIPAIELAKKLCQLIASAENSYKILFAPGATSAIGMALKLARIFTGRFKTISMWDSFHGASLDAISIGGESIFREGIGPLLTGCEHVPPPDSHNCVLNRTGNCQTCDLACARYIEYVLDKEQDIAAVIAEPLRCTAINPPPTGYWQLVRKACDKHGALLIFDETAVGLGRTGRMFAHQHFQVEPDMLVLGKGLGGGIMPLAALLARSGLDRAGHTALGHYTHEKNPLCCAAGLATIAEIEERGLVGRSAQLGEELLDQLRLLQEKYPAITDVQGLGLMVGVYLRSAENAEQVMYSALTLGLSFKVSQGNCLSLTPPLTISRNELARAVAILDCCLAEL